MKKLANKNRPTDYNTLEKDLGVQRLPVSERNDPAPDPNEDFDGDIHAINMDNGLFVTLERITSLRDHRFNGVMPAALGIRVPFGDDKPIVHSPLLRPFHPDLADAAVIANSEPIELDILVRKGQSFSTIGVIAIPEMLTDPDLAKIVREAQEATCIKPLIPSARVKSLAQDLFAFDSNHPLFELLAKSCALEIFATALATIRGDFGETNSSGTYRVQLDAVRKTIMETPEKPHHIDGLAKDVGMSATSLRRWFTETYGQSIGQFLREVRLLRAYHGILNEGWSPSESAYRVGYKHPSSFSHAFKVRFGIAPSHVALERDGQNS